MPHSYSLCLWVPLDYLCACCLISMAERRLLHLSIWFYANTAVTLDLNIVSSAMYTCTSKVRLALAVSGVPFEDVRIPFADWPARKATARLGRLSTLCWLTNYFWFWNSPSSYFRQRNLFLFCSLRDLPTQISSFKCLRRGRYGQLPCLTLSDGTQVWQSDAMLRWAGSQDPSNKLYPASPAMHRLKVFDLEKRKVESMHTRKNSGISYGCSVWLVTL